MKFKVETSASKDLIAALWSETLASAYQKMKMLDCRHLPVINEAGQLVGILSDRDIQRGMIAPASAIAGRYPQVEIPEDALVSEFMSSPVITVESSDSLTKAARLMIDEKISSLAVVDGKNLVGIITTDDLLKVLVAALEDREHPMRARFVDRAGIETAIGNVSHLLAQSGI